MTRTRTATKIWMAARLGVVAVAVGWGCDADQAGHIYTVAGTGVAGDGVDDLPATSTRLYLPQDITVRSDGRLFIADWNNHRVRALGDNGKLHIVAGVGELGLSADDPSTNRLNHPTSVAFDPAGRMVIAAWHNSRVKAVDLVTGEIEDTCGNGKRGFAGNGGPAAAATLDLPVAVVFDPAGNLLIADQANQMIRFVDRASGTISTIAGTGHCADMVNPLPCVLGDDGPAAEASFHFPIGQAASPGGRIALGPDGTIYVADTDNNRVRRIDGTTRIITTIAGTGQAGFSGDGGPATAAQLQRPADVAVGLDGEIYVADTDNHCVRVVTPDGNIATFAGQCGSYGYGGDDGPAAAATLYRPYGVEVARTGEVYIADTHNHRIRMVYR